MGTRHQPSISGFSPPTQRYDPENETQFRRQVESAISGIGAYVQRTIDVLLGIRTNTVVVTDTYTILDTDVTIVCNKGTAFTVTLPATVVGQNFWIGNIGVGLVTVDGDGTDTIDGDLTQDLDQWEGIHVHCYAANVWKVWW